MSHTSLERADEFLKIFDEKFYRKYSEIESFNATRGPYWHFILQGMQRAEACKSCPLLRAIVAIEVAVHAGHAGMLPPQAASQMFSGLEAKFGIPIEQSKATSDVKDERIPEILSMAIEGLPAPGSIPEAVLSRLLKGAESLAECEHITDWVKKELAYWKHDFKHFSNRILDRLEVDSTKRKDFEKRVEKKIEGAKARRLDGLNRSVQDGSFQKMIQEAMRPKVQEYDGGPWRPMTDEEIAEAGYPNPSSFNFGGQ